MNLLTLTLAALCLVSGALATQATLKRSAGDSGKSDIELTCGIATANWKFKNGDTEVSNENGVTEITGAKLKIVKTKIVDKKGSYTCYGDDGTESDPVQVGGDPKQPTLTYKKDGNKYTFTCKSDTAGSIYEFHNTTAAEPKKIEQTIINGLTITPGKMEISTDKFTYYKGKYMCKAKLDTDKWVDSVVSEIKASSASRLVTTSGLALSLCLMMANFVF